MNDALERCSAHLECPSCGYDLYGLPMEECVVRCPECGNEACPLLLRISNPERERTVRGMETLPGIAVACSFVALYMHPLIGTQWVALFASPVLAWLLTIVVYVRRYRFVIGAIAVLILFHMAGWLLLVGIFLCLSGICLVWAGEFALTCTAILIGGPMLAFGWWLYRRARGILRRMHDQLAARTAAPVWEPKP